MPWVVSSVVDVNRPTFATCLRRSRAVFKVGLGERNLPLSVVSTVFLNDRYPVNWTQILRLGVESAQYV